MNNICYERQTRMYFQVIRKLTALMFVAASASLCTGCRSVPQPSDRCDACWAESTDKQQFSEVSADVIDAYSDSSPHINGVIPTGGYTQDGRVIDGEPKEFHGVAAASGASPSLVDDGPMIGGMRLGKAQVTATEHALKLQEENTQLKDARKTLLDEIQRQRIELKAKQELLDRIAIAMNSAEQQLLSAESQVEELRSKIASMKREHQSKQIATDQMLNSIRTELDDALLRQFTRE